MRLWITTDICLREPDSEEGLVTWLDVRIGQYDLAKRNVIYGHARAAIVHVSQARRDLWDALNAHGSELGALYSVFFENDGFKERFAEGFGRDLLYVQDIFLEPSHRGCNIEFAIVRRLCDALGQGCELVVIPYEWNVDVNHWENMGFEVSTPGCISGFMHMKMAYRQPRIADPDSSGHFQILPNRARTQRRART